MKKTGSERASILLNEFPERGIFLTGIEGSDPWVGGERRDELREAFDFYNNYEERLERIAELGIKWLRFGMPFSQVNPKKGIYNFDFADKVLKKCGELGIRVIADLLHFGLPEWMHANSKDLFFQNEGFPAEFAKFARVFARRYPDVKYYTLVNEPFITAFFSTKLGIWNESIASSWDDDRAFTRAISNIARAAILARKEIENVWHEEKRKDFPIWVQNESFEVAIPAKGSGREAEAERFNLRRFAALDLIFGIDDLKMREFLISQGMKDKEYDWFVKNGTRKNTILGIDHYPTCVHVYHKDKNVDCSPLERFRLYEIVKDYSDRYGLPMLHTETNAWPEHALSVCRKTFRSLSRLKREGYPILGMGWYGDEYQVGWQSALAGPSGKDETPVGLFYKGSVQPVGILFGKLASKGFSVGKKKIVKVRA